MHEFVRTHSKAGLPRATCSRLGLSRREAQIFELIVSARKPRAIAALLAISDATVQNRSSLE